ncbi:MAG: hypothetical protein LBP69_09855, partial [Treponema sp.]|nr:hypothetical protein [Treponema sp.]
MTTKAKKIMITLLIIFIGIPLASMIVVSIAGPSTSGAATVAANAVSENKTASPPAPAPKPEDDPAYIGAWRINNFVDEFGDKTDDQYIALWAEGTFSNTAVKNENLRVYFLITPDDVGLQMYEDYFGETDVPATFILFNPATVTIRDKDGTDHQLRGRVPNTTGQRMYVTPYDDIIAVLKTGGRIRFSIADGTSTWRFEIPNADYFDR